MDLLATRDQTQVGYFHLPSPTSILIAQVPKLRARDRTLLSARLLPCWTHKIPALLDTWDPAASTHRCQEWRDSGTKG